MATRRLALVAEHSPRDHVGTALTVQTCAGSLLTMVTIRLPPWAATLAGWQWPFIMLVPVRRWARSR